MSLSHIYKFRKNNAGYTLIGMAIALTVAGLLVGGAVSFYKNYNKNRQVEKSVTSTDRVMQAISSYLEQNGRYPCPASLDIATDDPSYGLSVAGCKTIAAGAASGSFVSGMWVEEKTTDSAVKVIRGAVPFRNLNLPEFLAIDVYNTRLEYAVTTNLTLKEDYSDAGGGISLIDAQGASLLPVADSMHFLVLSHGKDKHGAYLKEGTMQRPCVVADTELDVENCNAGMGGTTAIYRSSSMADLGLGDPDHFDDYVGYYPSPNTPFWRNINNANDYHIYTEAQTVGIGQELGETPDPAVKLDVRGNILASGDVRAQYICDASKTGRDSSSDTSYCFKASDIFDGGSELTCPPGQYVTSIDGYGTKGLRVNCSAAVNFVCPAGQVMLGINVDNTIVCGYPPVPTTVYNADTSCQAHQVNGCPLFAGGDVEVLSLAAAKHGTLSAVATGLGGDYSATYQCQNREWVFKNSTGSCEPTTVPASNGFCKSGYISAYEPWAFYNNAGGGGGKNSWVGKWAAEEDFMCKGKFFSVASAVNPDNIACNAGEIQEYIEACPAGQVGEVPKKRTWVCDTATTGHWNITANGADSCVAAAASVEPLICPEGLTDAGGGTPGECGCAADITTDTPIATANVGITTGAGIKTIKLDSGSVVTAPVADMRLIILSADNSKSLTATVISYDVGTRDLTLNVTIPHGTGATLTSIWKVYSAPTKTVRARQVPSSAGSTLLATVTETRSFSCGTKKWSIWQAVSISPSYSSSRWSASVSMPDMSLFDSSDTSFTTTTGTGKSFVVSANMPYFIGQPVYFISRGKRSNKMQGNITAYNDATGDLTVTIVDANDNDTRADWDVYVAAPSFEHKGATKQLGDVCSIPTGTTGLSEPCYAPAGDGKYYTYKDCICQ